MPHTLKTPPDHDAARLAILHELAILDTPDESIYDRITLLVQQVFNAPIAVISFTDRDRHWFKSVRGLPQKDLPSDQFICAPTWAELDPPFVILDTHQDPRTQSSPLVVGTPAVRFYAGMPLSLDERYAVGTLCLMDTQPRNWSSDEQGLLEHFSGLVADLLQKRLDRQRLFLREAEHIHTDIELNAILQTAAIGIVRIDEQGVIESINPSVTRMFGYAPTELIGQNVSRLMPEPWRSAHNGYLAQFLAERQPKVIGIGRKVVGLRADGSIFPLQLAVNEIRTQGYSRFVGFITDLSAIEQAESALETERALLRSIIDSISHPMATVDAQGRLMLVNQAFAQLVGAKAEQMIGHSSDAFLPAEAIPLNRDANQQVLSTGNTTALRTPMTLNGQVHIFETTKTPLRDAQGAIVGVVTVAQDTTQLNRLAEQLKQGEHLRSLGERFALLGFWSLEFGQEHMEISPGFAQLLGLPEGTQQLAHSTLRALIAPTHHEPINQEIAAASTEHRPFRFDYALANPSLNTPQTTRWLRARGNIERAPDGTAVRLIGITQDVTEEINARQRVDRQRHLLNGLNEAVQAFMASVDTSDVWQQMLDHLLMLTKADFGFLGEVIHGEDHSRCLKIHAITNLSWNEESDALYARVLAGDMMFCNPNNLIGAVMQTGAVVVTHDVMSDPRSGGFPPGHPPLSNYLAIPLYQGTELVGVVAIANRPEGVSLELAEFLAPFTNTYAIMIANYRQHIVQQRFETALIASKEQAEQANRGKSEFLSSMSHELRTPLNAILGFAQLMAASRKEPLSDKQRGFVEHILKAGQHLLSLVNDVLNLAKIEAGELSLSLEPIPLEQLLTDPLLMVNDMAKNTAVTLHNEVHGADLGIVCVDLTRAKQILMNLLSNAIKYNRTGGHVTVRTLPLQRKDDGQPLWGLAIQDTGVGIPKSKQHRLFRPFERLGQESSNIDGSGIGLMISKQIVEQMGGLIEFDSEEGVGSTFSVFWPAVIPGHPTHCLEESNRALPTETNTATDTGSTGADKIQLRLLYVEDNPANSDLMRDIIDDRDDTELLLANTGERGLELTLSTQPDLILMDINLPGISGQQAAARLKKWSDTKHIPIIALSADATAPMMRSAEASGLFARYLTKPLNLAELNQLLDEHIALKQQAAPESPS
ncbi:PAS domain S-box protein [Halothiobacillus sp.]|uniref:PAS domain S-box protein n=1 Tax=Halothiobacillus sp. TaxID=1891311 RepID=UPI002AD2E399|nr:PAS domain S-box protein [Halothiobacillus sp.]